MKLAFITSIRAPYRSLQLEEYCNINNIEVTAYYTHKPKENRKWEIVKVNKFKEIDLEGIKIFPKYGYVNRGILSIIKNNDIILLGGYEQLTMIIISAICRIIKKTYVIVFDGISLNRLSTKENRFKKIMKDIVIDGASFILANGKVGKQYFTKVFNYSEDKIYNQYLAIDNKKIDDLYKDREVIRQELRKELCVGEDEKVLLYSGRLVDIKNVESVIYAISKLKRNDITFIITGGGELEKKLIDLAKQLDVKIIITGFLYNQEELFKHYFIGDAFILPSIEEPWGLVVNEAMCAGLPVLVSNICGCSIDLVECGSNGYTFDPYNVDDIKLRIEKILFEDDIIEFGRVSRKIIKKWNFESSKNSLEEILKRVTSK